MLPEYLPALITPFTQRGEIDRQAHIKNVRALAEIGVDGFLIGGSNGEGPYLESGERGALVNAIRRRKTHVMVGVSGESTRAAIAQVDEATDAGADTLLVTTPTALARNRDDAILRFYRAVADHSKIPVLIYSVPAVTGYSIPIDLAAKIARHQNVIGVKDSSGDVVRLQALANNTPSGFFVYCGASRAITGGMAVGCHGAITATGNYATRLVMTTVQKAKESSASARRIQKRLTELSAAVEAHGVPGVKAAAKATGLEPGYPRAPLQRLPRGIETSIAKLMS